MKTTKPAFLLALAVCICFIPHTRAQDSVKGVEPIDVSIDPAKLKYDYLVDGNLPQEDPANKKFKTFQAAYEAAPAGTEQQPTVIGIKPNVYQLPGGQSGPSLSITKNWITLLGLTNNRRSVVLADNRGHSQGASDNGYILNVNANGFTVKNLTILNYCNADYEYPGDPSKNLVKRSDVITQAVSLQAAGDKHVYINVALLSRLDTMFLRTTRSYFKNVYIEGTDDWMGGGQMSVWEDCTLVYPTGRGVMSASQVVFFNCKFEATRGMQFYKSEFGSGARPVVLINCTMPVSTPQTPVAWVRGKIAPRPSVYSLTYHVKDTTGKPAVIYDSSIDAPTFTYSRELSDQEALAFNPWNLLRANPNGQVDDWDPAGVKLKYETAGQGNLVYRMALNNGNVSIRTGGPGATIGANVLPANAPDKTIKWSTKSDLISLSRITGENVVVTGKNTTSEPQYVPVTATAANGFYTTAYVYVEPQYVDSPKLSAGPTLSAPSNGSVNVSYTLDSPGKEDQSVVSWAICDDAAGNNAREVAISRGNQPLKSYALTAGDVGKFLKVGVQPKHQISDPGSGVYAIAKTPIEAVDIKTSKASPNFRNFVAIPNTSYVSGFWTVLGTWTPLAADNYVNGYGVRVASQGAALLYQQDAETGDMQVDVMIHPEKTEGMAFGSPGSPADGDRIQKGDIYIKYDPRTKNGYTLRYWRTTQSASKCMYQFYKIENGAGSPLNEQQILTGVCKGNAHFTLKTVGNKISVAASNDVDSESLSLEATIAPNRFGGAGVYWGGSIPRGNSASFSQIEIIYPGKP